LAGSMVYRLPVRGAGAPHMALFRQAMAAAEALSDNRGYNFIAGFHGAPGWYCWHHQVSPRTPVQARLFLPWHRAYLWWLEQALQDRVEGAALPWWDWTAVPRIPRAYTYRTVDGEPNPLRGTRAQVPSARPPINRRTRRAPGRNPFARLPTAAEISSPDTGSGVLEDPDWASFSDRLENFHDAVHGWVGGDMGDVTTAAFDPIFFAHHCMIDRVWYLWQVRHGVRRISPRLLDLELIPFGKRVRDVLDVQALGYEYAASATEIPVTGAANG
jgi:tyrosinase